MEIYLVGGAVRDRLLDLPVIDRDWVVVGASPKEMVEAGYKQVGKDFPVFLHPKTNEEYALARLERKIAPGHGGFDFDTAQSVTLEEDLQRRDLTINAMAETESGEVIDPYGGQQDIEARLLRHVSDAFSEDPLRVLRVARFAARFASLGFKVADETMALMQTMSGGGELDTLVGERVWQEMALALKADRSDVFIQVLRDCGALKKLLPEVDCLFGIPQPEKYHPEIDTGLHTQLCLQQVSKLSDDLAVRYATLVHDVGKGLTPKDKWPSHIGHETLGLRVLDDIHARIPVPKECARLAELVSEHHTKLHRVFELRPATVLKLLEALDAFRRPERLDKFLLSCEADSRGRTGLEDRDYPQRAYLAGMLAAANELQIPELLAANRERKPEDVIREARLERLETAVQEARA